jgi:hypothetical protein
VGRGREAAESSSPGSGNSGLTPRGGGRVDVAAAGVPKSTRNWVLPALPQIARANVWTWPTSGRVAAPAPPGDGH